MRISDWSSDVCSSDLNPRMADGPAIVGLRCSMAPPEFCDRTLTDPHGVRHPCPTDGRLPEAGGTSRAFARSPFTTTPQMGDHRSEEHTSELQSLMRISYAVFCLKKKTKINTHES